MFCEKSFIKYLNALSLLGLDNLVNVTSVEHNCERILLNTGLSSLPKGTKIFIVNVPGFGTVG